MGQTGTNDNEGKESGLNRLQSKDGEIRTAARNRHEERRIPRLGLDHPGLKDDVRQGDEPDAAAPFSPFSGEILRQKSERKQ